MTRRKVKLAFIANNSDRKASYKKRKRGLMKKIQELSTLCGIDACAILYGPYDDEPEVWPSAPDALNRVLTRFKDLPEEERVKKMDTQEGFTKLRVDKMKEQLKNLKKDNRKMEATDFVTKCLRGTESVESFGLPDLNEMGCMIERHLKEITWRMAYLKKYGPEGTHPGMNMVPVEMGVSVNGGGIGGVSSYPVASAPKMPMIEGHHQMQNLTRDRGTLRTNEQQPEIDYFGWDYKPFLQLSIVKNNNGSGPSYGVVPHYHVHNNGAGPSFSNLP